MSAAATEAETARAALVSALRAAKRRDVLVAPFAAQETKKQLQAAFEDEFLAALHPLYADPKTAFAAALGDLTALDHTGFADSGRAIAADQAAARIEAELVAQKPTTRYGGRLRSACAVGPTCPLWATAPWSGVSNSLDIVRRGTEASFWPPVPAAGGGTQVGVLLRLVAEARKQAAYASILRRGSGRAAGGGMTATLWHELVAVAPTCLKGPYAATPANLAARPETFDLDPACPHRTWAGGPQIGRPISEIELGGRDRLLWAANAEIAAYNTSHGGPAEVRALLAKADAAGDPAALAAEARRRGLDNAAGDADRAGALLRTIRADTSWTMSKH